MIRPSCVQCHCTTQHNFWMLNVLNITWQSINIHLLAGKKYIHIYNKLLIVVSSFNETVSGKRSDNIRDTKIPKSFMRGPTLQLFLIFPTPNTDYTVTLLHIVTVPQQYTVIGVLPHRCQFRCCGAGRCLPSV